MAIRSCHFRVCHTYWLPMNRKEWILPDILVIVQHELHVNSDDLHNLMVRRAAEMKLGLASFKTQNNIEKVVTVQQRCASEFQGLERNLKEWRAIEHHGDWESMP
ncbi:MAG: hypothetical protein Q9192_002189 [Flavoplaca navasiana]